MVDTQKKPSLRPFGLPLPLVLGGIVFLVFIGLAGGVVLDLALRPATPVYTYTPPRRDVPPPVMRNLPADDSQTPSILAPQSAERTPPSRPEIAVNTQAQSLPPPSPPPPEKPVAKSAVSPPPPAPPTRAPATKPPVVANATPWPLSSEQFPALAIVIDDLGLDRSHTQMIFDLPYPITVSLMTYANDLTNLAARARAAGHEVLAHVPMQPMNTREDPGPRALTVAMSEDAIRATLGADLDGWQGYVGVNNHMGSRFTLDMERMSIVMDELKSRGLLWLDSRTTTESIGPMAAQTAGVPYVARDIFLDNVDTVEAVLEQIERAVATAKARGSAIAIGHPHDATITALKQALPTLAERGVVLVPVTEILKRQQAHARPS